MSKKSEMLAEQADALASLRKMLKPGDTVYCILRHRSASGMSRIIDLAIVQPEYDLIYPKQDDGSTDYDGKPKRKPKGHRIRSIGWLAGNLGVGGGSYDRDKEGVRVSGCGMDMGFHLVYSLGAKLWPNGTPKPHSTRNGKPDDDGGYALKHQWL
jgi:hypothetical protein